MMKMTESHKKPKLFQSISDYINKEYLQFLNNFDRQITRNLHEANIETRPVQSNGLWCCILLPAVLIIYNFMYPVSSVYSLVTYISLGLLFYCILFNIFLTVSCLVLQEPIYGGCIASSLVSALFLYIFSEKDLTASLIYSILTMFAFSTLLRISIMRFPKTFTIGEAMIITQSIVLYVAMTVAKLFDEKRDDELDFITSVVNTVLSTVGIIVTALSVMKDDYKNLQYLRNVVIGAAIFGIIMMHATVGINCVMTLLRYIFWDHKRVQLFIFWLALVMLSVGLLLIRTRLAVKASTVTRKSFHILASTVFLSGIVCDQQLMTLAAGVGLGLLILVEALRKSGIEPISPALESAFVVYSDEKDSGTFAMTPFYLYCGLACPLVLVPSSASQLEVLSGVLSIGVGDTAASWFGSKYGTNKWCDGSKSVEGTAFNIIAQIATVYALQIFNLIDSSTTLLIRTTVAATISALAEATTEQVDNLVLPIISLLAFQVTWPIS